MHMLDEIMQQPKVIKELRDYNSDVIEQIVARLLKTKPKLIVIAARGTSDHAAIYTKYCCEIILGIPVSLAAPSVITSYHSRVCYQDALVIGITQSGMAEDVRSVIAHAKKQKALTLSCTNNNDSPVAREADYHLYCNAEEEKSVAATKTFMAQMYAMISLLTAWDLGKRGGADSGGALRKALAALPEKLDLLLQRQDEIIPLMKSYKFMDRCFVLGRGLMYPIVKEAALKIMETTYTAAFAYPISDFWHGPLAMIHKQTPVFLYSGGGQLENDELEILSRLKEIGADVLAVTPSEAIASRADRFYMIPQTETFVIPFYHLVIAQLFAYGLTLEKGMDADSPRHIVKVTITK